MSEPAASWNQSETHEGYWRSHRRSEGWSGWNSSSWNSSGWNSRSSHKWSSSQWRQWREEAPEWKRRRWEPREEGQQSSWSGDASASRSYPEQGSGSSSSSQPAQPIIPSPPRRGQPHSTFWEVYAHRVISGELSWEQREELVRRANLPSMEALAETALKWHIENIGPPVQRTRGDQMVYANRVRDALTAAESGAPPGPKASQKIMPL